jgi:hypothetical protein
MTMDNFYFYLQNRLIQTNQTGGQWYNDTSPFSIPWLISHLVVVEVRLVVRVMLAACSAGSRTRGGRRGRRRRRVDRRTAATPPGANVVNLFWLSLRR